jgi:hypothetical protein
MREDGATVHHGAAGHRSHVLVEDVHVDKKAKVPKKPKTAKPKGSTKTA